MGSYVAPDVSLRSTDVQVVDEAREGLSRGAGVCIGSGNPTDNAWHKNLEAGCFFPVKQITNGMTAGLHALFATLRQHATPLTRHPHDRKGTFR